MRLYGALPQAVNPYCSSPGTWANTVPWQLLEANVRIGLVVVAGLPGAAEAGAVADALAAVRWLGADTTGRAALAFGSRGPLSPAVQADEVSASALVRTSAPVVLTARTLDRMPLLPPWSTEPQPHSDGSMCLRTEESPFRVRIPGVRRSA